MTGYSEKHYYHEERAWGEFDGFCEACGKTIAARNFNDEIPRNMNSATTCSFCADVHSGIHFRCMSHLQRYKWETKEIYECAECYSKAMHEDSSSYHESDCSCEDCDRFVAKVKNDPSYKNTL